ncbi:hypothetical protein AB0D74_20280, partial [Streptomyces sp. NPDC048278]
ACRCAPQAVLAAHASDPALAAMRIGFTDALRRTAQVTASGLLARQENPKATVTRARSGRLPPEGQAQALTHGRCPAWRGMS